MLVTIVINAPPTSTPRAPPPLLWIQDLKGDVVTIQMSHVIVSYRNANAYEDKSNMLKVGSFRCGQHPFRIWKYHVGLDEDLGMHDKLD